MNFKVTNFIFKPTDAGIEVRTDPALADVAFDVAVKPLPGPCRHGATGVSVRDDGNAKAARIVIRGSYSIACGEQGNYGSVLTHQQFIHGFFKAAWLEAGGTFTGQTRFVKQTHWAKQKPWFVWESPRTLGDVIRDINKFSNNVMARQVLLHMSYEVTKLAATQERARNATLSWLANRNLKFPELVVDNGAGLSRTERITAMHLAELLRDAAASPFAIPLKESLPVVGVDGTMRSRLAKDPIAGNAWIKTGSLSAVRTIAGYVKAASGREFAVVVLVNGPRAEGSQDLQDKVLKWVHESY